MLRLHSGTCVPIQVSEHMNNPGQNTKKGNKRLGVPSQSYLAHLWFARVSGPLPEKKKPEIVRSYFLHVNFIFLGVFIAG